MSPILTQTMYDSSPLGFAHLEIITDGQNNRADYRFLEVNPAFEKITGISKVIITGKAVSRLFQEAESLNLGWLNEFYRKANQNETTSIEFTFGQTRRWYMVNGWQTDETHLAITLTDITSGRQSTEPWCLKDLQQHAFWDNNLLVAIISDKNGNYLDANREACQMTGYSCEELKSMNIFSLIDTERFDDARAHFELIIKTGKAYSEEAYTTKSGEKRWWKVMTTRVSDDLFLGLHDDITSRKQAEQQLKEEKEHHANVISNISDVLWEYEVDAAGQFVRSYISPVVDKLLGLPAGTIGHSFEEFFKFIHPDDLQAVQNTLSFSMLLEEQRLQRIEYRIITGNGSIKHLRSSGIMHIKPNGHHLAFGITSDITEPKQNEEELLKTKANLMAIVENTLDNIWAINRNYEVIYLNENFRQAYFTTFNVLLEPGSNKLQSLPEPMVPLWKERYDKVLAGERIEFIDKVEVSSTTLHIEVAGNPILQDGAVIGASFFGRDITNRKKAEQALAESEERFRLMIKNISAIIVTVDKDGIQQFVSPVAEKITGYTAEELSGKSLSEIIHPDDLPQVIKVWEEGTGNPNTEITVRYRHIHKTKGWVHLETVGQSFLNEPAVNAVIAIVHDITERKRAEEALQKEVEVRKILLRLATEFITIPVDQLSDIVDKKLSLIGQFTGVDRIYVFKHNHAKRTTSNTHEWCAEGITPEIDNLQDVPFDLFDDMQQVFQKGGIVNISSISEMPEDHPMRPVFANQGIKSIVMAPLFYGSDNIGLIGFDAVKEEKSFSDQEISILRLLANIFSNVFVRQMAETELRQIQQNLAEKEAQYRLLAENSQDLIYVYSMFPEPHYEYISPSCLQLTGYKPEVGYADPFAYHKFINNTSGLKKLTKFLLDPAQPTTIEEQWKKKDGTLIWVEQVVSRNFDENGSLVSFQSTVRDITERKRAEEELQIRERRFSQLIQNSYDTIVVIDSNGIQRYVSPSAEKVHGYSPSELVDIPVIETMIHPADQANVLATFLSIIETGSGSVQYRHRHKAGGWVYQEAYGTNQLENPDIKGIVFNVRDITERKQSEAVFQDIIDKNPMSIQILDLAGHTIQTNSAHTKLFGVNTPDNYSMFSDTQLLKLGFGEIFENIKKGETVYFPDTYYNVNNIDPSFPNNPVWIKAVGFSLNDVNGNPEYYVLMHENITERKRSEDEIRKLSQAVEQSPAIVIITNTDGLIEYVNPKFVEITGYTLEEAKEQNYNAFKTEEMQESTYHEIWETIKAGNEWKGEFRNKKKSGELYWEAVSISPIYNKLGTITHFLEVKEDITQRKSTELEMERNQAELRTIYENAPVMMAVIDEKRNLLFANPAFTAFTGVPESDLIGGRACGVFGCINAFDDPQGCGFGTQCRSCKLLSSIEDSFITGSTHKDIEYNTTLVCNNAVREISLLGSVAPIHFAGKRLLLLNFVDISERKQAEEVLKAERMRLAGIIEGTHAGTWEWNVQTGETAFNERWAGIIGYSLDEISPVSIEIWKKFAHPDDLKQSEELLQKHFSGHLDYYEFESRMLHKNGGWIWVLDRGKVVSWSNEGKPLIMRGTHQDITERKRAEEALRQSEQLLRELNAQKDKFFSIIAHDLKSPFNSILGFSQLLVEQMEEKDYMGVEEYARIVLQSSERAMNLLLNLLEWSRAQTGKMEFNPEYFELVDFIEETIPVFEDVAIQKSIKILRSLPHNIPVYADKQMISTVMRNLINNAIKFTHNGGEITLLAQRSQNEVTILVKDNGVGISKKRLEKLFRIDESESTKGTANEQGTGLGLILCKEFVEKHGGRIWVESEEGKGSTFYFTLPSVSIFQEKEYNVQQPANDNQKDEIRKLKTLVVEDDEISEMLLFKTIENLSSEILKTKSGDKAIEIVKENPDIDLILMDIRLPIMNGYEATRQIRQFNKNVIIIAQTAYGLAGDREIALEAGCNDYIAKPISKDKLLALIQKFISK